MNFGSFELGHLLRMSVIQSTLTSGDERQWDAVFSGFVLNVSELFTLVSNYSASLSH